jgi:hypothetical protein
MPRHRRIGRAALILAALGAGWTLGSAAGASPLSATGYATGGLSAGQTVQVHIDVRHTGGWQQISEIELDLTLQGKPLEQLVFDPTHDSVVLQGEAGPAALGEPSPFVGPYFRLDPAAVAIAAKGERLTLSIPITIVAAPPTDARLTLLVRGFDLSKAGPLAVTAPVKADSGFTWGTLGLAVAVALFLGGVFGGTFASRRRPPQRPSVYTAVRRRIDDERAAR